MTDRMTNWLLLVSALGLTACAYPVPTHAQAQDQAHSLYVHGGPATAPTDTVSRFPMVTISMWQKFRALKPGLTSEQALEAGPFVPMIPSHGRRPGWCTLCYTGTLTPAEQKGLKGKLMQIDVQVVRHPGPVSASNPPVGCLNPSGPGDTIAAVSAPYADDGGPVCLD